MCGMCPCREGPQSFLPWLVEQEMGAGGGLGGTGCLLGNSGFSEQV